MFIEPMLASPTNPSANRAGTPLQALVWGNERGEGWVAEPKLDGLRAQFHYKDGQITLFNRTGADITEKFPEFHRMKFPADVVFDCELVSKRGDFQTVATREKQGGDYRNASLRNPCILVAFDVLHLAGTDLTGATLEARHALLRRAVGSRKLIRAVKQSTDLTDAWAKAVASKGEGIIVKKLNSLYFPGQRVGVWLKFKTVHSLFLVADSYESSPSRRMNVLKLRGYNPHISDGPQFVVAGQVGTGWTHEQGERLADMLDSHAVPVVEIHAAGRTATNQLRHPVFKGVREDKNLADTSIEQVLSLPTF